MRFVWLILFAVTFFVGVQSVMNTPMDGYNGATTFGFLFGTFILPLVFLILGLRSFRAARRAKEKAAQSPYSQGPQ
ncbi:MAG: hypothetical protein FWG17_03945 [Desulfovibrionaceae bacterium]|nr:hypothetical protein [Desulfovibrionaceae bacterium]